MPAQITRGSIKCHRPSFRFLCPRSTAIPKNWISLATITENFKAYTGWTNAEVHHVAGAIRVTEYDFFKRWVMKLVAWEKNLKLEPGKDLELTDWAALAATVDGLHARFLKAKSTEG